MAAHIDTILTQRGVKMPIYTRRVQTVLTDQQYRQLAVIALESGKPISVLIREAVEIVHFIPKQENARMEALRELLSLNAPVADWEQVEEEIAALT
jgi:hypothetical protein